MNAVLCQDDLRPALPEPIDALDVRGCLYLASLLAAQERRLSLAPTHRTALAALGHLRDMGVIEVPWPATQWDLQHAAESTPIEGLHWRYTWPVHLREGLLDTLEGCLEQVPRDDHGLAIRLALWNELSIAEGEGYFAYQLVKHRFANDWAQDFAFAYRTTPALSISQWRYCVWVAVRHGASIAQTQATPDPASVREAIYSDLCRRAARIASGDWQGAYPPFHATPYSALSRAFTQHLAPLGMSFWMAQPNYQELFCASMPMPAQNVLETARDGSSPT